MLLLAGIILGLFFFSFFFFFLLHQMENWWIHWWVMRRESGRQIQQFLPEYGNTIGYFQKPLLFSPEGKVIVTTRSWVCKIEFWDWSLQYTDLFPRAINAQLTEYLFLQMAWWSRPPARMSRPPLAGNFRLTNWLPDSPKNFRSLTCWHSQKMAAMVSASLDAGFAIWDTVEWEFLRRISLPEISSTSSSYFEPEFASSPDESVLDCYKERNLEQRGKEEKKKEAIRMQSIHLALQFCPCLYSPRKKHCYQLDRHYSLQSQLPAYPPFIHPLEDYEWINKPLLSTFYWRHDLCM